jgi:hypothetical protein
MAEKLIRDSCHSCLQAMKSIYRAQIPILESVTVRRIDDKKPPKIGSLSAEAMRKEADNTEAQPVGSE